MATEKLRAELEIITAKAEKDLKRIDRTLAGVEKRVTSIGGKGGRSLKPLGEGLSAATVNASEFEKSMAAANARVIAFGASAGLIIQVQRALKETVKATIEVEKSLADINVVLNTNSANLQKFGNQLFNIAGKTGQSFKTIAVGATELARQGLGTEKTLKRLNDAMILSRLTGMGAEEAVSSLTAAVNSFNKAGITSAQVVNKMAKVDQAFAVSSDDLAKAISRVGSSAVDAGVSMDELLAITTAVQQRTARGGAVIGNAFKTIFTRIGRTDVQKKLRAIGVETRDMTTGAMLPATKVLQNLANRFQDLSQAQQNQLAESVAGVFQVNVLRAALGDLASKYGVYNRALRESATATDEAYKKNEQLNQTLSAMVNRTLANLTKAGAGIGEATLKPAIENVLGAVNAAIGAFSEGGRFEQFGKGIGKDLLKGVGDFIAGPGLAILTVGIGKLAINFAAFAKTAVAGVLELNRNVTLRKNLEAQVTAELQRQPNIIKAIERGEISAAAAAKDMLATMKATNAEATKLAVTSRSISGAMLTLPGGRRPGRAAGFVPNFADPNAERGAAAMGGYRAGAIKTMNIPGQGNVMYNGAETVKQFPGMVQPAIMPPQRSLAGANYKKAFGAAHGFDPYAAGGFVPNFNKTIIDKLGENPTNAKIASAIRDGHLTRNEAIGLYSYKGTAGLNLTQAQKNEYNKKGTQDVIKETMDVKQQLGIVSLYGNSRGVRQDAKSSMKLKNLAVFREYVAKNPKAGEERIQFTGVQVATLKGLEERVKKKGGGKTFSDSLNDHILEPLARVGAETIGGVLGNQGPRIDDIKREMRGKDLVPRQSEGELFETAIKLALHDKKRFIASIDGSPTAPFDFEEGKAPTKDFKTKLGFHENLVRADAKRTSDKAAVDSVIKKAYNQHVLIEAQLAKGPLLKELGALPLVGKIDQSAAAKRLEHTASKSMRPGRAYGLVPNFSPLGDAITRERAAGVPKSAIRVGSSPALKGVGNPGGLGVYNTIHEPGGLSQGISRSRSMGINPKSHGVPNFAISMTRGAGAGIPIIHSGPRFSDTKSFYDPSLHKDPDTKESTKKLKLASKEYSHATGKFAGAVDKLNAGMGGLMMVGSMGAYMLGPAINRHLGREEGDQRFQGGLMGAFLGQSAGSGLGTGAGMLGNAAAARSFAMKRQLVAARAAGATGGMGRALAGGAIRGLSAAGRIMPHPVVKLGLSAAAIGGGYLLGEDLATEDPFDKKMRKKGEKAAKEAQEAQDTLNTAESFQNLMTGLVSNYGTLTGPQREVQFTQAIGQFQKVSTAIKDEDERKGIADDFVAVQKAMVNFSDPTKSLVEKQKELDKASSKLNDTLGKLGEAMNTVRKRAEGTTEEIKLQEKLNELMGPDAKKPFSKPIGKGFDIKAAPFEVTYQSDMRQDYDNPADILFRAPLVGGTGAPILDTPLPAGITKPAQDYVVGGIARSLGINTSLGGRSMGLRPIAPDDPSRYDISAVLRNNPNAVAVAPDMFDYELAEGSREFSKIAAEKLQQIARSDIMKSLSKEGFKYRDDSDLDMEEQFLGFRRTRPVELSEDQAAKIIGQFQAGGLSGLEGIMGKNESLTFLKNNTHRVIQEEIMRLLAQGISPEQLQIFSQMGGKQPIAMTDRAPFIFESLQNMRNARMQQAARGRQVAFDDRIAGMKEATAKGTSRLDVRLAERMFGEQAGLEAQRKADIGQSERDRDEAIRKANQDLQTAFESQGAQFTKTVESFATGKLLKDLDPLMSNEEARENLQKTFKPIEDLLKNLKEGRGKDVDIESAQKTISEIMAEIAETGGTEQAKAQLKALAEGLAALDDAVTTNKDTVTKEADAHVENTTQINEHSKAQKKATEELKLFYTQGMQKAREDSVKVAESRVKALAGLPGATGAEKAQAAIDLRRSRIAAGGGFQGMGGIRDAFTFNVNDAALQFDDAMVDLGNSIKDSTKGAIKNIISGAESFEDAMFTVFATLADKIANQGISMGVDSIFGALLGKKHGGYIPRGYNQGGVVTGGSGVRDDVMTFMQGGEYVIKKSAAQQVGYNTLNAINNYANGGKARVSLAKEFLYNDPTNRPMSGGFNISRNLSMQGVFNENDPQTGAMFDKSNRLDSYLNYRLQEQRRIDSIIQKGKQEKKARLMNAYVSAGLRIGAGFIGNNFGPTAGNAAGAAGSAAPPLGTTPLPGPAAPGPGQYGYSEFQGARGGSPALVMGGEYIMSERATAKYGTGFMAEVNRGRVPESAKFSQGGPVGGGGGAMAAGVTTNNVSLNINVGNDGSTKVEAQSQDSKSSNQERQDKEEVERSKQFGDAVRSAVLKEIQRQQRPGGLLRDGATYAGGRRP